MTGAVRASCRLAVSAQLPDPACVERLRAAGHEVIARDDPEPASPEALYSLAKGCDGLLCVAVDRIDGPFLDACPSIRWVANFGVGVDNVDLAAARARGVRVTNTPAVLTEAVADHCVGLVLAAARRIVEGDRLVRDGGWRGFQTDLLLGLDLTGATLGLVGLGAIGQAVARRLVGGFGMRGLYTQRHARPDLESSLGLEYAALPELLGRSDVITVHVPLTEETRGLIAAPELALLRDGAVIVNVARGPVFDEQALVAALATGRIRAGLDVFADEPIGADHPLCALPNVVLTPHIASAAHGARSAMGHLAVDNLLALAGGREPPTAVV